jgi:hypothetical protein
VPHAYAEARGVRAGARTVRVRRGAARSGQRSSTAATSTTPGGAPTCCCTTRSRPTASCVDQQSGGYAWVDGTGTHDHDVTDAFDFRVSTHGAAPAWVRDSVVYQIFPDRFARSSAADERALPGLGGTGGRGTTR